MNSGLAQMTTRAPIGRYRVVASKNGARADHPYRYGRDGVAQGQEDRAPAPGELGNLAFYPDLAEAADPLADQPQ